MLKINEIYLGDCLTAMKEIDNNSIDMINCDLPYGTTACKWDIIIPFDKLWEQYKRIIKDNGVICLTASQPFTTDLINSNREWFKYEWIWNKNQASGFMNANKMPLKAHENILIFYKNLPIYNKQPTKSIIKDRKLNTNNGIRRDIKIKDNVYNISLENKQRVLGKKIFLSSNVNPRSVLFFKVQSHSKGYYHPTQKPVALYEYLIKTYTNEDYIVLDNCIGSGTTVIACLNTGRNYIGIELNEEYFNIANKRIEEHKQQIKLL